MRIEAEKHEPLKKNKKPFAYERDVVQVETIIDEKNWCLLIVGVIFSETFGKWIADDLQLCHLQKEKTNTKHSELERISKMLFITAEMSECRCW